MPKDNVQTHKLMKLKLKKKTLTSLFTQTLRLLRRSDAVAPGDLLTLTADVWIRFWLVRVSFVLLEGTKTLFSISVFTHKRSRWR